MAQIVTDRTGIPVDKIDVVLGDSSLVPGPGSGGSTATASIIPAVADGADSAVKSLLTIATQTTGSPFFQQDPATLSISGGRVHASGKSAASGTPFHELLKLTKTPSVTGNGRWSGLGPDSRNYSTAANQVSGAVVMGVGMALMEQTIYDPRNGHPVTDNFADYLVPTNADSPVIDVHFLDIPDPIIGQYGARGIGEIGLAGVAPAITAAVYHATGVRVRSLPVRIEDLLTAQV
jgi:xanthine dehydrogenase YagR molybdenum-binding subunit